MDESLLRDILAAQRDMLSELRQIRSLLTERALRGDDPPEYPISANDPLPPDIPAQAEFTLEPETPPPASLQPVGTFTPRDLKDLGTSFAQPRAPKSRPGLIDVHDLRGSLLDEIKGKNRAKSRAYSEFTKNRHDE